MQILQFETKADGRRLGVVIEDHVHDVTAVRPELKRVFDAFLECRRDNTRLSEFLHPLALRPEATRHSLGEVLENTRLEDGPVLRPPVDFDDIGRVLISGTGLSHLGGMKSRDEMHAAGETHVSDSRKMFDLGLEGGRPKPGERGVAPEWFYKGNGLVLRGPHETLAIPTFAEDGGEEPEIAAVYIVDNRGIPCRLGFVLGNEWTDHATEKRNYLYLAPAKLRQCSIGPVLVTDHDFQSISLRCTVQRHGETIDRRRDSDRGSRVFSAAGEYGFDAECRRPASRGSCAGLTE
ncbi:MAG: sugar transporter [Planctomycetales bacterium]|nr:sugar transporter [Planctomycetales bacterium]